MEASRLRCFQVQSLRSAGLAWPAPFVNRGRSTATLRSFALPDYVKPIPKQLKPESLEYLHQLGRFETPKPKFRDALLQSYLEYFHPAMPVLDFGDFVHNLQAHEGQGRAISLLLFQMVMFGGSSHCDIKYLRALGFFTRKSARRAMCLKVKVSYPFIHTDQRFRSYCNV